MASVTLEEYTANVAYSACVTDVISVWLSHRGHDFVFDRFIFLHLDPDPFVLLF